MPLPPPTPFTSVSKLNKVQMFHFRIPWDILFFTDVWKLCGPEMSQFLPWMQQFLDYLWRLFICFNYIGEIDHFTLDLQVGPFRLRSLVVSDLRSETKGSRFESSSSLRKSSGQCLSVCKAGGSGIEELIECPPPSLAVQWFVNVRETKLR